MTGEKKGIAVRKPWRIAYAGTSTKPTFKICDFKHDHTPCQGKITKETEKYTDDMVSEIFEQFRKVNNMKDKSRIPAQSVAALRQVRPLDQAVEQSTKSPGAAMAAPGSSSDAHTESRHLLAGMAPEATEPPLPPMVAEGIAIILEIIACQTMGSGVDAYCTTTLWQCRHMDKADMKKIQSPSDRLSKRPFRTFCNVSILTKLWHTGQI